MIAQKHTTPAAAAQLVAAPHCFDCNREMTTHKTLNRNGKQHIYYQCQQCRAKQKRIRAIDATGTEILKLGDLVCLVNCARAGETAYYVGKKHGKVILRLTRINMQIERYESQIQRLAAIDPETLISPAASSAVPEKVEQFQIGDRVVLKGANRAGVIRYIKDGVYKVYFDKSRTTHGYAGDRLKLETPASSNSTPASSNSTPASSADLIARAEAALAVCEDEHGFGVMAGLLTDGKGDLTLHTARDLADLDDVEAGAIARDKGHVENLEICAATMKRLIEEETERVDANDDDQPTAEYVSHDHFTDNHPAAIAPSAALPPRPPVGDGGAWEAAVKAWIHADNARHAVAVGAVNPDRQALLISHAAAAAERAKRAALAAQKGDEADASGACAGAAFFADKAAELVKAPGASISSANVAPATGRVKKARSKPIIPGGVGACIQCGKDMLGKRVGAKTCSDACRKAYARRREDLNDAVKRAETALRVLARLTRFDDLKDEISVIAVKLEKLAAALNTP